MGISPCHNYWQFSTFINRKLLHTPTTHTFDTDTSQPAFVCQTRIFINQLRKEHFELLHGGAVSQEPSSGTVIIFFSRTAMLLQLLEIFYYTVPLWFYKNKWGNGKMKALQRNSHELNTIKTKVERGQPNAVKYSPDFNWWRKITKRRNFYEMAQSCLARVDLRAEEYLEVGSFLQALGTGIPSSSLALLSCVAVSRKLPGRLCWWERYLVCGPVEGTTGAGIWPFLIPVFSAPR